MEYLLERTIRLQTDTKFKGLYGWALQEVDLNGKEGRDQIPWTLSHYFVATELTVNETFAAESEFQKTRTWIRAALRPQPGRRYRNPSYSMFGTDRRIGSIQLYIHPVNPEDAADAHTATASGFVAYNSNDPISGHSQPDHLQFDMSVPKAEFDQIAARIAANKVGIATFGCHATGFYSDWTPDIEADEYKVLTSHEAEQQVEVPDGADITPPRLGKVWDASFNMQMIAAPSRVPRDEVDDDDNDPHNVDDAPRPVDPVERARSESRAMYAALHREVKAIKALSGLLAAVAILILIFR